VRPISRWTSTWCRACCRTLCTAWGAAAAAMGWEASRGRRSRCCQRCGSWRCWRPCSGRRQRTSRCTQRRHRRRRTAARRWQRACPRWPAGGTSHGRLAPPARRCCRFSWTSRTPRAAARRTLSGTCARPRSRLSKPRTRSHPRGWKSLSAHVRGLQEPAYDTDPKSEVHTGALHAGLQGGWGLLRREY
jgi:hypothetical protein